MAGESGFLRGHQAWPAPDIVSTYFGRSAQENRFAQEDRELGLDHIFSFHLPGQELGVLIGLSVWNLRIARGFALEPPPAISPAQEPRLPEVDHSVPRHWPRDPELPRILDQLDWAKQLNKHPGWTWDQLLLELRCPEGQTMELSSVCSKEQRKGVTRIVFRRPTGGCHGCPRRKTCFCSWAPRASKRITFSIPTAIAKKLRKRLERLREERDPHRPAEAGPQQVHHARFLAAAARKLTQQCFNGAAFHIEVRLPPPRQPYPQLVARDAADRQRRRQTWAQKIQRYALPEGSTIEVQVVGGNRIEELLAPPVRDDRACDAAR